MNVPNAYLIDMDGVLVRGAQVIPGAREFIERVRASGSKLLVLTNNSRFSSDDLAARLTALGLEITAAEIFTSAMATVDFLQHQRAAARVYLVGEAGLRSLFRDNGFVLTEDKPDYVVLGEISSYDYSAIATGVRLITEGARFVATNPDVTGPSEGGPVPACGAMAALISAATNVKPYFLGKPNPLMMRFALRHLGIHSNEAVLIGDRMDTDIVAGTEIGIDTILVLSGVTSGDEVPRFPYQPTHIVQSVDELLRSRSSHER